MNYQASDIKSMPQYQKYLNQFLDKSKDSTKRNKDLLKIVYFFEQQKDQEALKQFYEEYTMEAFDIKFNYLKNYHKGFLGSFMSSSDEIINELKGITAILTSISKEYLIKFLKADKENRLIFILYNALDFMNKQECRKTGQALLFHILQSFPLNQISNLKESAYFKLFMVIVDFQKLDQSGMRFWKQLIEYTDVKYSYDQYEWVKQVKEPQTSIKFQEKLYLEQILEDLISSISNIQQIVQWVCILCHSWFTMCFSPQELEFCKEGQKAPQTANEYRDIINSGKVLVIKDSELLPFQKQKVQKIFLKHIKECLIVLNKSFVEKKYLFKQNQFFGIVNLLATTLAPEDYYDTGNEIMSMLNDFLVNVQFPIEDYQQQICIKYTIEKIIDGVQKEIDLVQNIKEDRLKRLEYYNAAIQNIQKFSHLAVMEEELFNYTELLLNNIQGKQPTKSGINPLVSTLSATLKKCISIGDTLINEKYSSLELLQNRQKVIQLCEEFGEIWHKLLLFIDLSQYRSPKSFNIACQYIHMLIDTLIESDRDVVIERGRPTPKPQFSPQTQTIFEMIEYIINPHVNYPFKKDYNFTSLSSNFEKDDNEWSVFKGKLQLLKVIGKAFTQTISEIPISITILHDITCLLHQNFTLAREHPNNKKYSIIAQISIVYTQNMFGLDMPGIKLLIPDYLDTIEKILFNENLQENKNSKEYAQQLAILQHILDSRDYYQFDGIKTSNVQSVIKGSAIQILKSLYYTTKNYGLLKIEAEDKNRITTGKQLNERIKQIAIQLAEKNINTLKKEKQLKPYYDRLLKENLMGFFYLIIIDGDLPSDQFLPLWNFGKLCIDYNNIKDIEMSRISLQFIESITNMANTIKLDKNIILSTVNEIINILIGTNKNVYKLPGELLQVLLNWVLNFKCLSLIESPKLIQNIIQTFKNLELIDKELKNEVEIVSKQILKYYNNFPAKLEDDDNVRPSIFSDEIVHNMALIEQALNNENYSLVSQYANISEQQLLKTIENKNREEIISIINNLVVMNAQQNVDNDTNNQICLSQKNERIFTFVQGSENEDYEVKVIIRDCMGKLCWRFKYFQLLQNNYLEQTKNHHYYFKINDFFEFLNEKNNGQQLKIQDDKSIEKRIDQPQQEDNFSFFKKQEEEVIQAEKQEETYDQKNKIQEIIDVINSERQQGQELKSNITLTQADETKFSILKQKTSETVGQTKLDLDKVNQNRQEKIAQQEEANQPYKNLKKYKIWDGTRLFLSHFNMMFDDNTNWGLINSKSSEYVNLVNHLDKTNLREQIKIGVLYVKSDQTTQQEILGNQEGSPCYQYFIKYLGRKVALSKHLGFLGGLKPGNDGMYTNYYSDSQKEVIFHLATMMPNIKDDEQFIGKKRHIGNDYVNIIWCENVRKYRHFTISSQFNFAHILIYPLKNNLFRLSFYNKKNMNLFFPWLDNAVVSLQVLVDVIRLAAIQAHKTSRQIVHSMKSDMFVQPLQYRNNLIQDIVTKCSQQINKTEFNTLLFTGPQDIMSNKP